MNSMRFFKGLDPVTMVTVHNAMLTSVARREDGGVTFVVQHDGQTDEVRGERPWSSELPELVGRHGYLTHLKPDYSHPEGRRMWSPYQDPTLRRVPELDRADGWRGWICDARPNGFVAPPHILPGDGGRFVADARGPGSKVRTPPEMWREARRMQTSVENLLETFVADMCGLVSDASFPRADGLSRSGREGQRLAQAWLEGVYGAQAIDIDAEEDADVEAMDRMDAHTGLSSLFWKFVNHGGDASKLEAVVAALVDEQLAAHERQGKDHRSD
jgi:hypothetical protein